METILAGNFAKNAATRIYQGLEDDIKQLRAVTVRKINVPKNSAATSYYENKVVYDSRYCNNFTAYSRDFTVDWLYRTLMQALKDNGIVSQDSGESEILSGNRLIAAVDVLVRFVQRYVKTISTRNPNDETQTTLRLLCRSPEQDGAVLDSISENLSADVSLDYSLEDTLGRNANVIQKVPIQGLFGNLAKEIDKQRRFFIRYSITQKSS